MQCVIIACHIAITNENRGDTTCGRDNQPLITAALSQKRAFPYYHVLYSRDPRSRDTQDSHLSHVLITAANRETETLIHTSQGLRSTTNLQLAFSLHHIVSQTP